MLSVTRRTSRFAEPTTYLESVHWCGVQTVFVSTVMSAITKVLYTALVLGRLHHKEESIPFSTCHSLLNSPKDLYLSNKMEPS